MEYHLAQINVAQAIDNIDSVVMQGFKNQIDEINAIADTAEGFVWRLQGDEGSSTTIRAFDDPLLLVNMSVWRDLDSLKNYVYKSVHVDLIRDRDAWFHKMKDMHQALWWVPANRIPSLEEGKEKLQHIQKHGVSEVAFSFAKPFDAPA
jgi:hypothetical protein